MSDVNLSSKEWCDVVFEGKNKDFGAYDLRRDSPNRHNKAMLAVILLAAMAIFLPRLVEFVIPEKEEVNETVTSLSALDTPDETDPQDEVRNVEAAPPPPLKSSIKFTPPVIEPDDQIKDDQQMLSQKDVAKSKDAISTYNVDGVDDPNAVFKSDDIKSTASTETTPKSGTTAVQKPYERVDQMPQYPGGDAALKKYLADNTKYPPAAEDSEIEGRVTVRFVVSPSGKITNVEVIGPVDRLLDEEAVRVVKSMPDWIAGKQNGVAVPVYYIVPVVFKLQ